MKDKIEIFGEQLKELNENIRAFKKNGVDEEILIAWLIYRLKVSKKEARSIIQCQNEFYNKLIKEGIVDKLKD